MIDDVSDIVTYYASDPAREHDRLERHQLERDLTWRYLDRYLPPQVQPRISQRSRCGDRGWRPALLRHAPFRRTRIGFSPLRRGTPAGSSRPRGPATAPRSFSTR